MPGAPGTNGSPDGLRKCDILWSMSRSVHRFASLLVAAALAFAQLAVSVYACPMALPAPAASAIPVPAPDCPDLDPTNLCAAHCAYGSASADTSAAALPAMDVAPLPWRVEASPDSLLSHGMRDWVLARSTYPPPPILFGVLRI